MAPNHRNPRPPRCPLPLSFYQPDTLYHVGSSDTSSTYELVPTAWLSARRYRHRQPSVLFVGFDGSREPWFLSVVVPSEPPRESRHHPAEQQQRFALRCHTRTHTSTRIDRLHHDMTARRLLTTLLKRKVRTGDRTGGTDTTVAIAFH